MCEEQVERRIENSFFLTLRMRTWGAMAHPLPMHSPAHLGAPGSDRNNKSTNNLPDAVLPEPACTVPRTVLKPWTTHVQPPLPPLLLLLTAIVFTGGQGPLYVINT